MRYLISNRSSDGPRSASTVITCDEVIVWATPAYAWAVGIKLELRHFLPWLARKSLHWECVGAEFEGPKA